MPKRHQLAACSLEAIPRPGERETYRPTATLNHLQRAQKEAAP